MISNSEEALDFSQKASAMHIRSVSLPTVPAHQDYSTQVKSEAGTSHASPTSTTETENGSAFAGVSSSSVDPNYFQTQAAELLRRALMDPMIMAAQNYSASLLSGSGAVLDSCGNLTSEQSIMPTTSLAISALHRRKRKNSVTGSSDNEASSSEGQVTPRKSQKMTPGNEKDDGYWERRRKNNLAAKRSRDARRAKEDEIAFRAALLEQENVKLKAQVNVLKNEMSRLHYVLFSQTQQ